jgi:hypothetical protein
VSGQGATRVAWSTCAVALALTVLGFVLLGLNRVGDGPVFGYWVENTALALSFPTVGAVIAARRPDNSIGWIFIAAGLSGAAVLFSSEYALYALFTEPGALPAGRTMAWISAWVGTVAFGLAFTFLFLLFPDGRLPSARWRPVAWLAAGALMTVTLAAGLKPRLTDEAGERVPNGARETIENPLGVEGAGATLQTMEEAAIVVFVLFCALPAAVSLILRYRRSAGERRQQIKWLAWAAGVLVLCVFILPDLLIAAFGDTSAVSTAGSVLETVPVVTLPLATGVAILRHRLYDVDVVIRRTVVYAALTAMLAGAYLAAVLLLQLVLSPLTEESDLAIAGSTLAVAALFRPARRRIQELVDRRFYRRRYDAARTIESFGARLRQQVDLDALGAELRGVIADTMQPAHVSLWLREGEGAVASDSVTLPGRPGRRKDPAWRH